LTKYTEKTIEKIKFQKNHEKSIEVFDLDAETTLIFEDIKKFNKKPEIKSKTKEKCSNPSSNKLNINVKIEEFD